MDLFIIPNRNPNGDLTFDTIVAYVHKLIEHIQSRSRKGNEATLADILGIRYIWDIFGNIGTKNKMDHSPIVLSKPQFFLLSGDAFYNFLNGETKSWSMII